MKTNKLNAIQSIAIIALVAVIGFAFITCDNGGGGGNNPNNPNATVATKFKFRNAATNSAIQPNASIGIARSVTGPGGVTYEVDDTSFSSYNNFYNTFLGGDSYKVGTGITPTKFSLPVVSLIVFGDNGTNPLYIPLIQPPEQGDLITDIDFAQGLTLSLDNVAPGTYNAVQLYFAMATMGESANGPWHYPKIEFSWPEALKNYYNGLDLGGGNKSYLPNFDPTIDNFAAPGTKQTTFSPSVWNDSNIPNNKVTTMLELIDPRGWSGFKGGGIDESLYIFTNMFFVGNKYKIYAPNTFNPNNEQVTGYPPGNVSQAVLAVPFAPIVIPENATSVTFEVRWDLTNMVQQYKGIKPDGGIPPTFELDTVENDGNDIFVLKNKFWEGLSITATVN